MADAYTPNLGLTLMENGTHNNTWNDEYLNNDERIDAKIGDITTINSTGGTQVLTGTQERVKVIKVTGALVSALAIEFSGVGGDWIIQNDTTGAFAVTVRKTGQPGVTIAQGAKSVVYFNGTDIATLTSQSAANLGLGSGDSPQFAGINVGDAADTTITRSSAGRIAVEGQILALASDMGWTRLASGSASGSTLSVSLAAFTASAYRAYKIVFELTPVTDGVLLKMRTSTNGGSSYDAGASDYSTCGSRNGTYYASNATDAMYLNDILTSSSDIGNASGEGCWGEITIHRPVDAFTGRVIHSVGYVQADGFGGISVGSHRRKANTDIDAFRLFFSSGNISSGAYTVYGLN